MALATLAIIAGLALLVWSADQFVAGAAASARHFGMPPLLIGMVIIGFGTSAPEMLVSAVAATEGNPGIALGNAYGSNISNIALILGLTAVCYPITVKSGILRKELPVLALVTAVAGWQLLDGRLGRGDAAVLLAVFAALMGWTIRVGLRAPEDALAGEMAVAIDGPPPPLRGALLRLALGLVLLIVSSRLLVWGAVLIARGLGVSDLMIGLTVIALGTSLPELASSLAATRKGEHDIALGNVLGSNLFNTLGVVGLAAAIHPMAVEPGVLQRDVPVMAILTLALFAMGYGLRGAGRINRFEGALLLAAYGAYMGFLLRATTTAAG